MGAVFSMQGSCGSSTEGFFPPQPLINGLGEKVKLCPMTCVLFPLMYVLQLTVQGDLVHICVCFQP